MILIWIFPSMTHTRAERTCLLMAYMLYEDIFTDGWRIREIIVVLWNSNGCPYINLTITRKDFLDGN
jgi:hypothetical protein